MSYRHNKTWRKRHPKTWRESKQRYYDQFRPGARNRGERWTTAATKLIIARRRPHDRVLAKLLGRSVRAIQMKRHMILRGA